MKYPKLIIEAHTEFVDSKPRPTEVDNRGWGRRPGVLPSGRDGRDRRDRRDKRAATVVGTMLIAMMTMLPMRAATVVGTIVDVTGTPVTSTLKFAPLSNPQVVDATVITSSIKSVTATNGAFSVTLTAGDYQVTVGGRDTFSMAVPSSVETYNIQTLVTESLVYTYSGIPGAITISPATSLTIGGVKTDETSGNPVVYLKTTMDGLLAGKLGTNDSVLPVNVKRYGAVGDGVTDDTSSISNAIESLPLGSHYLNYTQKSGTVFFPPGRYKVSSPIRLYSGIIVQGAGRDASSITNVTTTNDTFQLVADPSVIHYNVVIRDLGISGPINATAGAAINLDASPTNQIQFILENIDILHHFNGVHIKNVAFGNAKMVRVVGAYQDGWNTDGTMNAVMLQNCSAWGCSRHGFYVQSATYCSFLNSEAEYNLVDGWRLGQGATNHVAHSSFISCGAEYNAGNGFRFDTPWNVVLTGCYNAFSTNGFMFEGGYGISLINCGSDDSSGYGIYLDTNSVGAAYAGVMIQGPKNIGGVLGDVYPPGGKYIRTYGSSHVQEWGGTMAVDFGSSNTVRMAGDLYLTNKNVIIEGGPSAGTITVKTNLVLGAWAGDNSYRALSFEGTLTAGDSFIYGAPKAINPARYINAPTGGALSFRQNNVEMMSLSGTNLSVGGNVAAASLIATNSITSAALTTSGTNVMLNGNLTVYGNVTVHTNLQLGAWGGGDPYVSICFNGSSASADANFFGSLKASNPDLYINRPSGGGISFRRNNVEQAYMGADSTLTLYNLLTLGNANNIVYSSATPALGANGTNIVVDFASSSLYLSTTTNMNLASVANAPASTNYAYLTLDILANGANVTNNIGFAIKVPTNSLTFPLVITNGDIGRFSFCARGAVILLAYTYFH